MIVGCALISIWLTRHRPSGKWTLTAAISVQASSLASLGFSSGPFVMGLWVRVFPNLNSDRTTGKLILKAVFLAPSQQKLAVPAIRNMSKHANEHTSRFNQFIAVSRTLLAAEKEAGETVATEFLRFVTNSRPLLLQSVPQQLAAVASCLRAPNKRGRDS
jgi:hypothetical protein